MADLPAYTIEVARLFDAPSRAEGLEARYRAEFDALTKTVGPEALRGRCGSDRFEACDLSKLDALFSEVKD